MKRGSISLKLQWNITSHLSEWLLSKTPKITRVGEDVEKNKTKPSYTVGRNINWQSYCGKQHGDSSKHWKYDYHTIYSCYLSEETKTLIWKDMYTPMFIAPLFTMPKIWKQQPVCPSMDEWIKKKWDIMKYFSVRNKTSCHSQQHGWTWRVISLVK